MENVVYNEFDFFAYDYYQWYSTVKIICVCTCTFMQGEKKRVEEVA